MRNFAGQVDRSSRSVRQFSDGFDRAGNRMSTPLQKLRDYVLVLGNLRLALINVRDLAVGWVANLVGQSAKVERLMMLMRGMSSQVTELGKVEESKRNINELFDMARKTGFAMDSLADSFVKFKSAKLDPRDGSLQALADAVAAFGGTSDVMHRASIAIQQMSGKGVVSMEELRQQLGEAVPTAMGLMARAMGKTVAQLSKEVATGTVKAGPALALMFAEMQRTYSGAGAKLSQTMTGQLAELRTNIMQLSTEFTGLGNKQGLFANTTNSIRELNEALKGDEGRAMVASLGNSINSIAMALTEAVKVGIQFRNEIGAALQAVAIGIAMITAKRFGAWILSGAETAIAGVRALGASFRQAGVEMAAYRQVLAGNVNSGNMWAIQNNAAAMQLQQIKSRIAAEQTLIGVTRQAQATARTTITNLQTEATSYRQLIPQIQAQVRDRQAQLRAALTLHAANQAVGRSDVASAEAVRQAQANLTRETTLLTRTRVMLRQVTNQAALAEAELAAAQTAETAAVARLTAAEAMNTLGKRAMATATTIATGAVRLLQGAMTLALNPVVMIGLALYQAANAAGVFETRADRAAAAADRLRQGMGSLADMEAAVARRRQIREEMEENKDVNPLWGVTVHQGDNWWNTGLNTKTNDQRRATREALAKEDADLARTINGSKGPLAMQMANQNWQRVNDRRGVLLNQMSVTYGQDMDKLQAAFDAGDKTALAKMQARSSQFDQAKLRIDRNLYRMTVGDLEAAKAAGKPKHAIDALNSRVVQAREQMEQTQSQINNTANQMAMSLGNGVKGLDKWQRAAVTADGVAAAATARMNGQGAALAKFNAELAGGKFTGATEEQIGRLRRAATATDALAASKKAAAQEDNFESRLVSMAGRLAQLQDALEDGPGGELAKLNAQLDASSDKLGLTTKQIQALRDVAQHIDETKHDKGIKKLMDGLTEDFTKAKVEGDELWRSFSRGTFEADQRLAAIKGRFAEKLVGLSGQELTNAQQKIDEIVAAMQRADAVDAVRGWRESTEDMRINMLDENAQREANFQRELARQQQLLDVIRANAKMSADEKRQAEESFLAWKAMAEQRDRRQSEMALAAQARQWTNLGQNIQSVMSQALGSIVEGMFDARVNFGELVGDIIRKIMMMIVQAMIAYAILSAIGMTHNAAGQNVSMKDFLKGQMSSGFSLGGSQSNPNQIGYGAGGAAVVAKNHNGGMVGNMAMRATVPQSLFEKAQTRHNGGWIGGRQLKPGEVPLIGLEDEVILNQNQQKLLGKAIGSGGAAPNVQVNVINNSGTELETEHGEPEFNGKDMIVNVVVEAAQKQGKLRDVFTQLAGSK